MVSLELVTEDDTVLKGLKNREENHRLEENRPTPHLEPTITNTYTQDR